MNKTEDQAIAAARDASLELKKEFGAIWRTEIQPFVDAGRGKFAASALAYEAAWKAFRAAKQNDES